MRDTSVWEKLIPSLINAFTALILSTPFYLYWGLNIKWKLSVIFIFYIMQVLDTHENIKFRCLGMRIFGTVWERKYSRFQKNVYSILYTLSFSTLLFYVYLPFDLFLVNMLLLQLPSVLIFQTTFHGLLVGGLRTKIDA